MVYSARVHERTQGIVEYLDANLRPLGSDQDGPYHPNYCDTAGISPAEAQDTISANRNPLETIWQENYIWTLLPQCESFILNPPSDPKSRNFEYKRLSEHIVSQIVLRLDAVDLQGDHALRQKRKEFVDQAEEMLARLDDLYQSFNLN